MTLNAKRKGPMLIDREAPPPPEEGSIVIGCAFDDTWVTLVEHQLTLERTLMSQATPLTRAT